MHSGKYKLGSCADEECEEEMSFRFCHERLKCDKFSFIIVHAVSDPSVTYVVAKSDSDKNYFHTGKYQAESLRKEAKEEGISLEEYMKKLEIKKIIDYKPENMKEGIFYEIEGGVIIATKRNGEVIEYT